MAVRTLVPLKIKSLINPENGHAKYPDFNRLSSTVRKGLDWSKYIDIHGTGMHYDKTSGHKDDSIDSPLGQQWCITCVPQDFADAAVLAFPDECSIMTETEYQAMYDDKCHCHEADEKIDTDYLNGLHIQRQLKVSLGQSTADIDIKIANALDPNHPSIGVRKNPNRRWVDAKTKEGITIDVKYSM